MRLGRLSRCTASASMLYTSYVANHSMLNQTSKKEPNITAENNVAMQPPQHLSAKTLEFMAKLQKIHDNVLRDIDDL